MVNKSKKETVLYVWNAMTLPDFCIRFLYTIVFGLLRNDKVWQVIKNPIFLLPFFFSRFYTNYRGRVMS